MTKTNVAQLGNIIQFCLHPDPGSSNVTRLSAPAPSPGPRPRIMAPAAPWLGPDLIVTGPDTRARPLSHSATLETRAQTETMRHISR